MYYRYEIFFDVNCKRYIGISPDVKGLIAECDTIEEVKDVIENTAQDAVNWQVFRTFKPHVKASPVKGIQHLGRLVHG